MDSKYDLTKMDEKKPKVDRLVFDSYIAFIRNSIGTNMFRNFYAKIDDRKVDIMRDGGLSSAMYVSSILALFRFIEGMHGTIDSTEKDLVNSGWVEVPEPKVGGIIIYEPIGFNRDGIHKNQRHIGFYIGNYDAISNNSDEHTPQKHHYTYKNKRKIEKTYWNPKFDADYVHRVR